MKLLEFSFKNIFSYGNKLQRIEITPDQAQLILICGARGQGKSSIKEAMVLSAYGKSPNRSLKVIPNRLNKNAYLQTKFIAQTGEIVEIERGLAPNFLEIKINGQSPKKLPEKKMVESYIENTLIQIPYNVFCNTITVSVNDFKSFVSLSPEDKRKIVDKIFGVGEINDMNALNKKDAGDYQKKLDALDFSIERNRDILDSSKNQLEELKKDVKASNDALIEELKNKYNSIIELRNAKKVDFEAIRPIMASLSEEVNAESTKVTKLRAGLTEIKKKLELYEKGKCPHCLSDLTDEKHQEVKNKLICKQKEVEEAIPKIVELVTEKHNQHKDHDSKLSSLKNEYYQLDAQLKTIKNQIDELSKEDNTDKETARLSEIIDGIEAKMEEAKLERDEIAEAHRIHLELIRVFAEDGMKRLFMAKMTPLINLKIIERCAEIEFPYSFELNENFDPIIRHLGQSIELESLSTGEQKEMNLITLFSILDVILSKKNLNFLFLDEVFTSLDSEAIFKVVSMLRKFTDKHKITVFAVSHDPLPAEFFDKKLTIKKDKHFSDIYYG
jgi:DNA repair exonuclease SbcCD ATPase subunit